MNSLLAGLIGRLRLPTGRPEPVGLLDFCKLVVAAAVTVGWLKLDSAQAAEIGTLAGGAVWLILSLLTRAKVTPSSDPRAADGTPLVPADAGGGRHEKAA